MKRDKPPTNNSVLSSQRLAALLHREEHFPALPRCRPHVPQVRMLPHQVMECPCEDEPPVILIPYRENLLKFPHLAAVQHNNCMYLAHHLLTLGHHFRAHLPQPLGEGVATFVDMVPGFRKLGEP